MHKKFVFSLLGLALFTILFSACRIIDANALPKNTQVGMTASDFAQKTVTIKKGQSLTLVDQTPTTHTITNGKWNGATQQPAKEPGAPTVNVTVSSGSANIGPFNTAGTFDIYCTIHQGMNLTVTVSG